MTGYAPYALAERLETRFGDPRDPATAFSTAACLALDEREEFPAGICAELDAEGFAGHYVPAEFGGAVATFEDTLQAVRFLARRDLTVAIGHGKTFLGTISVWLAADPARAREIAAEVLDGAVVSWGLTERDHGSDLLAGEVRAVADAAGYRVDGEKWLINNATRGRMVCLLARTDPAGGPRGFSLFMVDKDALPDGAYEYVPRVRTHGVRGAEISGIAFHGARLPGSALVGEAGRGMEIVLKGLQLTRTLCAALSLGAGDQALRTVTGFAREHVLYGRAVADLPHARRTLGEAHADLLAAEVVSLVGARAIHALPAELSVVSAAVKYLVPVLVEELVTGLGQLLGTRSFLLDVQDGGVFQKVERDHHIIGIFDGSSQVNLNALVNQFPALARGHRRGRVDTAGLAAATDLSAPPPPFRRDLLDLVSRHGSSITQSLPGLAAEADDPEIGALLAELTRIADTLHRRMGEIKPSSREVPAEAFELAHRYALCFAGAACARFHLANRAARDGAGLWEDGLWLRAVLTRLLRRLAPGRPGDDAVCDLLVPHLLHQHAAGLLFSPLPCRLTEDAP